MRDLSGNYRLLYQLGRGGMGQVWGGVRLGRENMVMPCAIKVLHPALAQTERDRERFFNEARIAAQLDHGRIVKVTDTSEVQGSPCLVMEWVDGVNLRELLDKVGVPLSLEACLYVVGEILAALEYAHERTVAGTDAGVIHYDVTPGNILISSSGEVKLTDFGIARFAAAGDGTMSRSMGTPRYMSAEQMSGRARRETDIYSLGVVLHELLDGARYLDGCDRQQFQTLVLDGYVPELKGREVPAWVDQLRRQMLANRPDDRPSAADARSLILQKTSHYHLAGQQLRELYQRFVGERRSGLTELMNVEELPGVHPHQKMLPSHASTPVPEADVPRSALSQEPTATGLPPGVGDQDDLLEATEILEDPEPEPAAIAPAVAATQPRRSRRIVDGLLGGVLVLASITLGVFVTSRADEGSDEVDEDTKAEERPIEAAPAEPEPAQTKPTPPTTKTGDDIETGGTETGDDAEGLGTETDDDTETGDDAETGEIVSPQPPVRLPRVEVTFMISGVAKAQIKVGSRVLAYDHVAMIKLRPNKYVIRWRESEDAPWHELGTLVVDALAKGAYYEARLGASDMSVKTKLGGSG